MPIFATEIDHFLPLTASEKTMSNAGAASAGAGAASEPKKKARGTSAADVENMLVARSWVAASEDPIVGKDQKQEVFQSKHVEYFFAMVREAMAKKVEGYEELKPHRPASFPTTTFNKLRKITMAFLSVRKRFPPRVSGENNLQEYYERIRPEVEKELKAKQLPAKNSERFEQVVDYLKDKPKFMSLMASFQRVPRPAGKRQAQQTKMLGEAKKKAMAKEGISDRSLFGAGTGGGNDGQPAAAASMATLVNHLATTNGQMYQHAMLQNAWQQQNQAYQQHNHLMAVIAALNPQAAANLPPAPPPPPPPPPPPALASLPSRAVATAPAPAAPAAPAVGAPKNPIEVGGDEDDSDTNDE